MSNLKSFAIAAIGAVALGATAASALAATPQVSDGAYLQAQRCAALISSPALGAQDSHGIDQFLKIQDRGRDENVYEQGEAARQNAAREARTAGAYSKTQLIAERDGVCRSYVATPTVATAKTGGMSHAN